MFVRALAGMGLVDGAVPITEVQDFHGWLVRPSYAFGEESSSLSPDNWPFASMETTCALRFTMLPVQSSPRTIYG